jgi:serine/threonine-protein kinase RsbT
VTGLRDMGSIGTGLDLAVDASGAAGHLIARVPIREEVDVAMARKHARQLGSRAGLTRAPTEALATAVSEIARNIVVHATRGEMSFRLVEERERREIVVVARDRGPGIPDPEQAMRDGYSTVKGLGLGLSGARRLVDEFKLVSVAGRGTTVILVKWCR